MTGAVLLLAAMGNGPTPDAGSGSTYQDLDLFGGGAATLTLAFNSNGTATITGINDGLLASWNWISPTILAAVSGWTVRVTVNSGAFDSGSATGSDLAVTSNRSWLITRTAASGTDSCNFTLVIKNSGGTTIDSATYDFEAIRP